MSEEQQGQPQDQPRGQGQQGQGGGQPKGQQGQGQQGHGGQHGHGGHRAGRHRHRHRHGKGGGGHGQHPQHGGGHPQHGGHQQQRQQHQAGRQQAPRPQPHQPSEAEKQFHAQTPVDPFQWIQLEKGSNDPSMRAMDLLCPIGRGTRGLIVAPPKAGKTTILKQISNAVHGFDPDIKQLVMLIDERP